MEIHADGVKEVKEEERKFHRLTVTERTVVSAADQAKRAPTGANTIVLLDGQPLKGVRKVVFEAEAGGINKITLEMYGFAEINVLGELETKIIGLTHEKKDVQSAKRD